MLPQHGGVPNFKLRLSGPTVVSLVLVLLTGLMLTLSFYAHADEGDLAAQNRVKLTLITTLLLAAFILLAGSARLWHPHLWKHGNSQKQHRGRRKHRSYRHQRRS